jgi:hypothetical protein
VSAAAKREQFRKRAVSASSAEPYGARQWCDSITAVVVAVEDAGGPGLLNHRRSSSERTAKHDGEAVELMLYLWRVHCILMLTATMTFNLCNVLKCSAIVLFEVHSCTRSASLLAA